MTTRHNPTLYQINTRVWLSELSRTLGRPATLRDVSDEFLDRIAEQGFEWLWPLGVWQTGPTGRAISMSQPGYRDAFQALLPDLRDEDITGSPYAIRAYRVHEDFGGDAALADLRARLQRRGVRLLLDFVPNHTAPDHEWVASHPEYYVVGSDTDLEREPHNYARVDTGSGTLVLAHGRDPYFPGWADTFQLNYRSRACHQVMSEQLLKVANACDGVRCDMAMLLLPDVILRTWGAKALPADGSDPVDASFWIDAIARVRKVYPQFTFMAEVYWDREWDLQQQGFDYTYDKRLYDRLSGRDVSAVRGHLYADPEFQYRSVRFLENHDEPRAATTFPWDVHPAAALVAYTVPGLRFFYEGQLDGRRAHVPMHVGRRPLEPVDQPIHEFYARLLEALKRPELRDGRWRLLSNVSAWADNPTAANVLGFSWELESRRSLVIINYAPVASQCFVHLPWLNLTGDIRLRDLMSDAVYVRSGSDLISRGLYVDLPAWHGHLFSVERL